MKADQWRRRTNAWHPITTMSPVFWDDDRVDEYAREFAAEQLREAADKDVWAADEARIAPRNIHERLNARAAELEAK